MHNCGLGKSLTCISAANLLNANRILVVTRSMGKDVYARDCKKINENRPIAILSGIGTDSKATRYQLNRYNKYLTSYYSNCLSYREIPSDFWMLVCPWEILHAHVEKLLSISFDVIIFDEHHMGKGRTAKRTDAAIALSKKATVKWSVSATPVRDRLRDLWAQWRCVDFYGADSSWKWVHRYCSAKEGRYGGLDTTGESNIEELKERLSHLMEIKTRQEILHLLPGKMRNVIRIDTKGKVDTRTYEYGLKGIESAIAAAANLKRDEVVDRCVEGLMGREKIILTGNRRAWVPKIYQKIVDALPNSIKGLAWIRWATGESSVTDRQQLAREYMAQKEMSLLIATSDAIGESIDLHDTDRMIVAALPYSPGALNQLEGRVSRLGGSRPVTIDFLVAEGTIDEQIEDVLLNKLASIEAVGIGSGEVKMGAINEDEVMENLNKWLQENQGQN